jgi:hypothetical protein
MKVDILTTDDLMVFKAELLGEIKELLSGSLGERDLKPFLKSKEVRKLLSISAGTLHSLRIAGKIKSKRIGNLHFYSKEEIEKLMEADR